MRLLFLILLAALVVGHYDSQKAKASSRGILGKALLRRALEAMSNSPKINVNRRSLEEDNSGDKIKQTDAIEDIFVGTGSRTEERGASWGARRSGENGEKEKEDQSDTEPDQSGENDSNPESSGEDGTQTKEQSQELEKSHNTVETESPADQSETQPSSEEKPEDRSEDFWVSSGNVDAVETASEGQSTSPAKASSETSASEDPESSNTERTQETNKSEHDKAATVNTMEVAKNDQAGQESKQNENDKETDSEKSKKSTIAKAPSISTAKELAETPISSGESDEATSGADEVTSEDSSGTEDDGSAEAIRKGMESLSKLLKPVANGVDFQLFSGAAKPEDTEIEEDEEEEERSESKAEGKGESDKAKEIEKQKPRVVKLKKCETKCALPMSYDQCAVPRCDLKVGTIKDLCVWLCKHQKPVCKKECKEVE